VNVLFVFWFWLRCGAAAAAYAPDNTIEGILLNCGEFGLVGFVL
jgi:hypothetical protein